jgi:hypothetical protein
MTNSTNSLPVPVADASAHGLAFAQTVARSEPRLAGRLGLGDGPIEIFDVGGDLLFYDFPLLVGDRPVGHVRAAADERVGSPGVAVEIGSRSWDPAGATTAASRKAETGGASVTSSRLVCYCYPKIGVELTSTASDGQARTQIFDVANGSEVPATPRGDDDHEAARSFLAGVDATMAQAAFAAARTALAPAPAGITPVPLPTETQQVWLDPACKKTLGLPMYAQITNFNCVPASAQMMLDHYGWNYPQSQIATDMGTNAAAGGTSWSGVVAGISTLTNKTMTVAEPDVSWAKSQQWSFMTTEIGANRPVFTQMPGHYRVCLGYSITWGLLPLPGGQRPIIAQTIHIHDPWPWNANVCQGGADYWESWFNTNVQWFVSLQH